MGQPQNNARANIHRSETKQNSAAKTNKSKGAPDSAKVNQFKTVDDLESFFSVSSRSNSAPKSRATTMVKAFKITSLNVSAILAIYSMLFWVLYCVGSKT